MPIIVSFNDKVQLLGIPETSTSSGEEQAMALYQAVQQWCLTDQVQVLVVTQQQAT